MRRKFVDLTREEIIRIAKACEQSHPICVASMECMDPNDVYLCIAHHKLNNQKMVKEVV